MGKKGKWFGAVKKVFSPESKEKKEERLRKKSAASNPTPPDLTPSASLEVSVSVPPPPAHPTPHQTEEVKVPEAEEEQSKHATVEAAPAAPAQTSVLPPGVSREELAAIKIQTAFRGYLARRALRALRGLVRLKSLVEGNSVKRQSASTLRCMQTLSRVQSQIRSRRVKMSEENQAFQRQLLLKQELENFRMGENWDDSTQSKEQIEASLISRQEATIRRERALAYAFSHQWKSTSRSANPMFVDPNNLQWGWSWLERWMAAKPWEGRNGADKESNVIDRGSVKSMSLNLGEGEITKAFNRRDSKPDKPSPTTTPKLTRPASRQSPSTPSAKVTPIPARKKSATPKNGLSQVDDDARSVFSVQSERPRRHSIATSAVRDDESLASSPSLPSYMVPTESARAKSRLQGSAVTNGTETPEKGGSAGSVKKRLSFQAGMASASPMRRHSGPPKVGSVVKGTVEPPQPEALVINGGNK
ncbi:protein IQ-DOMAIN 2-like [Phragmites australis]|uniref:protein IQ-DOMAIN 2-like n=1 Tax=Phragmites australis TaxID=29695 RepID=UPI002D77D2E1|nr:protein IQ-DOMAIN 2-like [Phragmites australis]XP_062179683.1 protein IQ-DOMAIN 2-like [Phragmites australis]XP_062179684.1 protein IQ-DOMAIN 2-like [Phragmites australis]XP_062179685.1 protein IQ-DOMAIN 2-like [Phragmites australis]